MDNLTLESKLAELKLILIDYERRKASVEIQIAYVEEKIARRSMV